MCGIGDIVGGVCGDVDVWIVLVMCVVVCGVVLR